MWLHQLTKHVLTILGTLLLGGFFGAALVRLAPGFGVDEQELDLRMSESSIRALRRTCEKEQNILAFYGRHVIGLMRGDLGFSRSAKRPVAELLRERLPITLRSLVIGVVLGWSVGLVLALPVAVVHSSAYELLTTALNGVLLCLPVAALALAFLFLDGPVPVAIGLAVMPKIYRYVSNLLKDGRVQPYIVTARARGLGVVRIGCFHVLTPLLPQIFSLGGVSVSLALGAAVPIEVICDSPGIGQLAWQAAQSRDLALLVTLTLLVTLITLLANLGSDLMAAAFGADEQ
jgi:peptide/nickel transport system permease protein